MRNLRIRYCNAQNGSEAQRRSSGPVLPGSDLKPSMTYPNGFIDSWAYDADMHPRQRRRVSRRSVATEPRSGRKRPRNQTLVTTSTGRWRATYNGENRPVRWVRDSDNTTLVMSYDHMGRRRTKNAQRFVYNGYLQIANHHSSTSTSYFNYYLWDPTEPVATRPLVWQRGNFAAYYVFDGNKNVSEVASADGSFAAHYEYAPFGAVILQRGTSAAANPWRFSSEFADDEFGCDYYNYREYEPVTGRWLSRDPIEERGGIGLYGFYRNSAVIGFDVLGREWKIMRNGGDFAYACAPTKSDTFSSLAKRLELDRKDLDKWAHTSDGEAVQGKFYKIPNLVVFQDSVRTWKEKRPHSVFSRWERMNEQRTIGLLLGGFKVIYEKNVAFASSLSDRLGLDGLYSYTYTGHGSDDYAYNKGKKGGDLVASGYNDDSIDDDSQPPDSDALILNAGRYTIYGISAMTLQACNSGNSEALQNWSKNVAKAGRFVGYKGAVNNNFFSSDYYGRNSISTSGTNGF